MQPLEYIYHTYYNTVYRFAVSYTHNTCDAEDVTQATFLKYFTHRHRIAAGKEKQWLLRVAHNACVDIFRKKQRVCDEPLPEIAFYDAPSSELFQALESLTPEYRAVIHLFYFEGYSTGEIAKILRVSQTCVTTRLSRARKLLKEEMAGDKI